MSGNRRVRLNVAYDGTEFCGFQRQPGKRTVQGVLEQALSTFAKEEVRVHGAGRTDAGVHARGQVVHFECGWAGPVDRLPVALFSRLPRTVAVWNAHEVDATFHARYSAVVRRYGYAFVANDHHDPLLERYALRTRPGTDFGRMQEAAVRLVGRHDFAAFASDLRTDPAGTTIREVIGVRWMRRGRMAVFLIQADGFLRHMVRNIVGGLLEVGSGRLDAVGFEAVLQSRRQNGRWPSAPAAGLCLLHVGYEGSKLRGKTERGFWSDEDLRAEGRGDHATLVSD